MRGDRSPDDRWPPSAIAPEKKPVKLGDDQMALILQALPFSKRVSALNGLVLRAKTLPELHVKVRAAIKQAKKNGLLPAMTTDQKNFKKQRESALKKTAAKKVPIPSRPKHQPKVGTEYGDWITISESYFPDKTYPNGKKVPKVDCRCKCGTEMPVILNSLMRGRSQCCRPCSGLKAPAREAARQAALS